MATRKERPAPSAKKAAPPKKAAKPQAEAFTGNARAEVSADELRKLIAEAAYYRAKERGFTPGHELEDWIQAEAEVMGRIGRSP